MTVKKHLRAQEVADAEPPALHLPRRLGAARSFPSRPRSSPTATTSAASSSTRRACRRMGIPQIAVVMGSCTAGGAYVPAMADETVIVRGTGTIFVGGPPLVKAATGQEVTAEELGGADVHTRRSGVADHYATSDEHALAVTAIDLYAPRPPARCRLRGSWRSPSRPHVDPAGLYGSDSRGLPAPGRRARSDRADRRRVAAAGVQAALRRDARHRLRADRGHSRSASSRTTGSCSRESAQKGAHFVELCCKRRIPLVFLQNITGFMVGKEYEAGGIARDGAKLVTAVANAEVPKFTVVDRRKLRRRQLRDVRSCVRSAAALDVAERPHLA